MRYEDAVNMIYNNNPILSQFVGQQYFGYDYNLTSSANVFLTTGPYNRDNLIAGGYSDLKGKAPTMCLITVYEKALDEYAAGTNKDHDYACIVNSFFHELVYVKQDLNLKGDGSDDKKEYNDYHNKPENEFHAYYEEFLHKDKLPGMTTRMKNFDYGGTPVRQYILKGDGLSGDTKKYLINTYKTQILQMMGGMTKEAASILRTDILSVTGIKL